MKRLLGYFVLYLPHILSLGMAPFVAAYLLSGWYGVWFYGSALLTAAAGCGFVVLCTMYGNVLLGKKPGEGLW